MRDNYTVALYIRLSVEDENDGESNSVKNQRDLLKAFAKKNPELSDCKLLEFCDDGHSGINFDRPAVKKMLEQIRKGEINCLIVKDFSRFGRSYIEVGDYLEQVFPFLDIRFISVNDNYDSDKDCGSLGGIEVALRTLIYDLYSKDLSQKVKSAINTRRKKGEYLSNYAIYGYKKSDINKRQLVIDEEPAAVVRRIFEMAMSGENATEIARILNTEKIPTKGQYKKAMECTRNWDTVSSNADKAHWMDSTIWKTISDERYMGTVVGGRYARKSFGCNKVQCLPKSEWVCIPNMHEAIVTAEEFALARKMMTCGPRPKSETKQRYLYNKVRCHSCNHALIRTNGKVPKYYCETPRFITSPSCTTLPVSELDIEETLLSAIRIQAKSAVDMEKVRFKKSKQISVNNLEIQKAIKRHETTIKSLIGSKQEHYESLKDDLIDKAQYFRLRESCNGQIEEATKKIEELKAMISESEAMLSDMATVTDEWHRALKVERLSKELVDNLVDSIIVYDSEHIEIKWKYADEYSSC